MEQIKKPEGLLLDLDGVLVDTEALNGEAWKKTAEYFGKNINKNQLKKLLGRTRIDCAKEILDLINKDINMDELLSIHSPIQKKLIKTCLAIDSSEKLVRWLDKKAIPTALVTSSSRKSVEYKISLHPWINLIPIKVLGDDPFLKNGKPAPDPFLIAAKRLNLKPQNCWVIEDSESGIKSALSANCQVWDYNLKLKKKYGTSEKKPIFINKINIVLEELKRYFKD